MTIDAALAEGLLTQGDAEAARELAAEVGGEEVVLRELGVKVTPEPCRVTGGQVADQFRPGRDPARAWRSFG